jgi:hypothetical protein
MIIENNDVNGTICYLEPLNDDELKMVNLYWGEIQMSVDKIKALFPQLKHPSSFVPKVSGFAIRGESFRCTKCQSVKKVSNRKYYLIALKTKNSPCKKCNAEATVARYERNLAIIEDYKAKLFDKKYDLTDLSYIEKINLFLILNNYYIEGQSLSITSEGLDLAGSHNIDSRLLMELSSKGCLVMANTNNLPKEVQEAYDEIYQLFDSLKYDETVISNISYVKARVSLNGVYFNVPNAFDKISDVKESLYFHICSSKITISDIQELTLLVEGIRLENLYGIIDWLVKEKCKLPIDKNMKLDSLLKFISKKHPLAKLCNSMYYQAREVVFYIHKNDPLGFRAPKLFGKFLSDYFAKVEENNWELKYPKALPMNVSICAIESFVCDLYFEDHFNWTSLGTNEIISIWLKKLELTDTKLLQD